MGSNNNNSSKETDPLLAATAAAGGASDVETGGDFDDDGVHPLLRTTPPTTTVNTNNNNRRNQNTRSASEGGNLGGVVGRHGGRRGTGRERRPRGGSGGGNNGGIGWRTRSGRLLANRPTHRKNKTSLGDIAVALVQDEAELFSQTLIHELQEANDGRRYFLDMTMTRSLSVLPENLENFLDEVGVKSERPSDEEKGEVAAPATSPADSLWPVLGLIVAVLAVSSNGSALAMLHNVPAPLKLYWRCTATFMVLSSILIIKKINSYIQSSKCTCTCITSEEEVEEEDGKQEQRRSLLLPHVGKYSTIAEGDEEDKISPLNSPCASPPRPQKQPQPRYSGNSIDNDEHSNDSSSSGSGTSSEVDAHTTFTYNDIPTFVFTVLCFTCHTLLLVTALDYTSIGNAVIGANSQAIILVLGKLFIGQSVHWMECLGVIVAFSGCILCSGSEAAEKTAAESTSTADDSSEDSMAIYGDIMALGSGIAGVGYLTFAKSIRSKLPSVTVFMCMMMFCMSFLLLFYMTCMLRIPITLDMDLHHGLFGWMTFQEQHVYILLHIAVICNFLGTMGFVRAMAYFDNIIIAVATLLEPLVATLIAFVLGVGQLPNVTGWIGNLLVVCGTLGVVYPAMKSGKGGGLH